MLPRTHLSVTIAAAFMLAVAVLAANAIRTTSVEGGADNVLVNPGFENGQSGWDLLDGTFTPDSGTVRSGVFSGRLTTSPASQAARLVQEGSAFPGDWDASVFVSSNSTGVDAELNLEFFDSSNVRLVVQTASLDLPSSGFQELSFSLVAPAGTTSYRFHLVLGEAVNATATFDDAFLAGVAAPPPTQTSTPTPPASPTATPPPDGSADDDEAEAELAASLYLRNPTFEIEEDGLSRHWKSEGGEVRYTTELVRSGTAAGHAVGNLSTPITVSQTVRLLNENTRRFAVYALGSPPGGSVQLEIQWLLLADQPIADPVATAPMTLDGIGYQEIALVATPPPRAAGAILTITIVNGSLGDNVRLDDASWRTSRSTTNQSDPDDDDNGSGSSGSSQQAPVPRERPSDLAELAISSSEVVISEVFYSPEGDDAEWIELQNQGESAVWLNGWTLFDNLGQVALGSIVLAPGGYLIVASDGNLPAGVDSAQLSPSGDLGNGLANDGDYLALVDNHGALADSLSWGDDGTVFPADSLSAGAGDSLSRLAGEADTNQPTDFQSAHPTPQRGLAAFGVEGSPSGATDVDEEEDDTADGEPPASSGEDDSSGLSAWVLVAIMVVILIAVGATVAWFRREELAESMKHLQGGRK
jgi:hypothetical protein